MRFDENISAFYEAIAQDARINPRHIAIYIAILNLWYKQEYKSPVYAFSKEVMRLAKISAGATYHRSIKELCDYGYLSYIPSFNKLEGSAIMLVGKRNSGKKM